MAEARVYATRPLPGGGFRRLAEQTRLAVWRGHAAPPRKTLEAELREAEGLLCLLTDPVDADLIASAPRLRVISSCSVGLDHVDLVAATARGIPVGHTPGVLAETTADLTLALMLAAARRLAEADRFVRSGAWKEWDPELLLGRDLHGSTVGLIGLGDIGQAVARRLVGFECRILGWTPSGRRVSGIEPVELDALLAAADFVSLHVALAPETRHLLDAGRLARMKPGAVLVNAARGGLVDETALAARLASGALSAAGLDVFEDEPPDPESPLLGLDNVVLTPHLGSASVRTRIRMADLAVENLLAGLAGRPLPACANPEARAGSAR